MARNQREITEHPVSAELQKYIRVQTVGMSVVLAWPVAMILADMYGQQSIIPIMSVLMVFIGVIIFAIGYVKREELKERNMRE